MPNDAIDRAAAALEEAARKQHSEMPANAGERGAAGAAKANIAINWKCITTAAVKYGVCRMSGGSNCEQALFDAIKLCK